MVGVSFFRVLRGALQNFWRNIWLSVATMVIMTITLLIVLFLYFANLFGAEVIKGVQQKVDLSVVFKEDISAEQMQALARQVESREDVVAVKIISSEEAKEIFLRNKEDKPYIEEALRELEDNPLPASMFIVAADPREYQQIAQFVSAKQFSSIVAEVQFEDTREVIDKLIAIISTIKSAGIIVTLVFSILVVLIMFNTVRLAIYSFREEIDIMHLVGASRWFIRGPFVLESVLIALISVLLASLIIYPSLSYASEPLKGFFFAGLVQQVPFDIYQYATDRWPTVIGLQIAVAVGLAVFSSLIALQRYLKS